jgi:hypothetical protein
MTIIEAITYADEIKPNSYTQSDKVKWLSQVDGTVKKEIIDTHEGAEEETFSGYDDSTPLDTPLLIPHPYDEAYIRFIEAQIDYLNGEMGRYNNSMTAFKSTYASFERFYNRTHMPIGNNIKYF